MHTGRKPEQKTLALRTFKLLTDKTSNLRIGLRQTVRGLSILVRHAAATDPTGQGDVGVDTP